VANDGSVQSVAANDGIDDARITRLAMQIFDATSRRSRSLPERITALEIGRGWRGRYRQYWSVKLFLTAAFAEATR
jgi:hypothetical protein